MHAREHPAHERQTEPAFLAGASIRLRSGLFLRDARAVVPDDETDSGSRNFSASPERAGPFLQAVCMLDNVREDLIATDQ